MGQQQLFLGVVGMIIVGVAISVAVTMFQAHAIESSRNAIIGDLLYFASKARSYYWKPAALAGGNHSFTGLSIQRLSTKTENENGRYFIESASTHELILVGKGKVVVEADTIEVRMHINEQNQVIEIIH